MIFAARQQARRKIQRLVCLHIGTDDLSCHACDQTRCAAANRESASRADEPQQDANSEHLGAVAAAPALVEATMAEE
jgi:hypothetical protein